MIKTITRPLAPNTTPLSIDLYEPDGMDSEINISSQVLRDLNNPKKVKKILKDYKHTKARAFNIKREFGNIKIDFWYWRITIYKLFKVSLNKTHQIEP
jgi:hypothetical protein